MHSSRPPRGGSSPAALPALLRASHLFGLALGSALGKLRDSGVTAARMFERAEEQRPAPQDDARGRRDPRGTLGQGARAPSPSLRAGATLSHPAYQEFPRPVTARDGGDVSSVGRDDRTVGDGDDEPRRRGPTSPGCSESSRPALRRRGQGRRQDDGAGRVRRERSDRADAGASRLEAVGTDGGTDPQGAVAGAPGAGAGLDGPASREGKAPESRLDGGSDGRERAVRARDVQGRGRLRCVLANATLGQGVLQGGFCR